jgi:ATP-dependent DNA helicase RecG
MRPQSLTPLFAQTTSLPGIGPRLGKLVEKLAGPLVVDLLWHLPFAAATHPRCCTPRRARSPP